MIQTEPQTVEIDGQRFEVWVQVVPTLVTHEVRYALRRDAERRREATNWRPYDAADGERDIAYSILNGARVGVRYLGPVERSST